MKKYFFIFKSELMTSLQYVSEIAISFFGWFIHIFVFMNLWKYIYTDPDKLLNGYSINQMIWYVIITEIVWSISSSRSFCKKIVEDVKTGNITYNINKPYSYVGYVISTQLGKAVIPGISFTILGILVGYIFLGSFPVLNILQILIVLVSAIIAVFISVFFVTAIGLLSFFMEDSAPVYWLYSKLILIVGILFPIEYFPKVIQPILSYSPIFVISYAPAKLFVDFSYKMCVTALLIQGVYLLFAYLLCVFIYEKGERKLNVNGG